MTSAGEESDNRNHARIGNHRLPRRACLKRRTLIRALFDRSSGDVTTTAAGRVRLLARPVPVEEAAGLPPVLVAFSAGRFRSAVARNRIKRLLREAYRKHQNVLDDVFRGSPNMLTIMVLYRGQTTAHHTFVARDVRRALDELGETYRNQFDNGHRGREA